MTAKIVAQNKDAIDSLLFARRCREIALQRYVKSSCIETSQIFASAAAHLGLPVTRMVCQVAAYSPKLAQLIKAGTANRDSMNQPGMWSVGLGLPQSPEDFVGRMDTANNRFVGHVVCMVEDHLVDPTVDQMSRPEHDMSLQAPFMIRLDDEMRTKQVAWAETADGVLIKYVLHPKVAPPAPVRERIIERLALSVAREFGARA